MISGVRRRDDDLGIVDALRAYCAKHGYPNAIVVGLDGEGDIAGVASARFPARVADDLGEQINEALARIHRGQGLQS
jgi:pimeloyl-ACP methyl ester carboxylesterase